MTPKSLLHELATRGITVGVVGDKLRLRGSKAAYRDLLDDIVRNKTAVVRTLRTADPRLDLVSDSARWGTLLALAHDHDADDPQGLYVALLAMRCCGARLVHEGGHWLILPRPSDSGTDEIHEAAETEMEHDKRRWLMPHRDALLGLLSALSTHRPDPR
jgi:hypothetical protein